MRLITNKKVLSLLYPNIYIYVISNDNIFFSEFFKNFSIELPHEINQHKDLQSFYEAFILQKHLHKKLSLIVYDISEDTDIVEKFDNLNHQLIEALQLLISTVHFIYLSEKKELSLNFEDTSTMNYIKKNNNSYIRIQSTINSIYNNENINIQKKVNIYIFTILASIIAFISLIITFLIIL